jgi:hypothetical protein
MAFVALVWFALGGAIGAGDTIDGLERLGYRAPQLLAKGPISIFRADSNGAAIIAVHAARSEIEPDVVVLQRVGADPGIKYSVSARPLFEKSTLVDAAITTHVKSEGAYTSHFILRIADERIEIACQLWSAKIRRIERDPLVVEVDLDGGLAYAKNPESDPQRRTVLYAIDESGECRERWTIPGRSVPIDEARAAVRAVEKLGYTSGFVLTKARWIVMAAAKGDTSSMLAVSTERTRPEVIVLDEEGGSFTGRVNGSYGRFLGSATLYELRVASTRSYVMRVEKTKVEVACAFHGSSAATASVRKITDEPFVFEVNDEERGEVVRYRIPKTGRCGVEEPR